MFVQVSVLTTERKTYSGMAPAAQYHRGGE